MMIHRILCLVIGYCFGLFQTGYFIGKAHNVDIRQHGSGNAGATNSLRTLGLKAALGTFIGDLLKAMIPMIITWFVFRGQYGENVRILQMYAGLGAVLGHNFPFYLKFKGGKGIACTSGFILAFYYPIAPICLVLFICAVFFTRYVSLGSILVVITFYVQLIIFGQLGYLTNDVSILPEIYGVGAVFTLLALFKHRENIKRLLDGTENKLSVGKKEKEKKNDVNGE